jgi:hypothetical protein
MQKYILSCETECDLCSVIPETTGIIERMYPNIPLYYLCSEADQVIADAKAFALGTQRLMNEKVLLLIEKDARIEELESLTRAMEDRITDLNVEAHHPLIANGRENK